MPAIRSIVILIFLGLITVACGGDEVPEKPDFTGRWQISILEDVAQGRRPASTDGLSTILELNSDGKGAVINNGHSLPVNWKIEADTVLVILGPKDGEEQELIRDRVWVQNDTLSLLSLDAYDGIGQMIFRHYVKLKE